MTKGLIKQNFNKKFIYNSGKNREATQFNEVGFYAPCTGNIDVILSNNRSTEMLL